MNQAIPFSEAAECLAQLGHPHRLRIFNLLVQAGGAGLKVGEIQEALALPKSTVSHHLAELASVRLISQTREGRVIRCRIEVDRALNIKEFMNRCCDGLPAA
ncbi:MAG TPA: metalloregulator ArsR/SmtB family transcription factor [Roseiarcus sp.]|nr:metalloregulator ArsR/SmtB family transcription factor [Roseiarcus sp.]